MNLKQHVDRMREELDMAYRAEDRSAAAAHFGLAALHLAEIDRQSAREPAPKAGVHDPQIQQLSRYYR